MVQVALPLESEDSFAFTPVASRLRLDGWTPTTQTAFIAALAAGDSVTVACRRVGRSPKTAYALRKRTDAASFAAAWDHAVAEIDAFATATAIERCLDGTRRPVVYRGRIIGERVSYDDRFLMQILRRRRPQPGETDMLTEFNREMRTIDNY